LRNNRIILLIIAMLLANAGVLPIPGVTTNGKTTMAVVVYESSEQPIAPYAMAARDRIEAAGIEYRITDKDVETGDGQTPVELKPAIDAAKAAGLPSLVMQAGEAVQRVVPFPKDADAIVKEVTGAN
jgi:hypothetical protein